MAAKAAKLDRASALSARPKRLPFLRRERTDGKLRVTVLVRPAGWARWLGGSGEVERTFALDAMGQEVYEACDGTCTVEQIARQFAGRHKVSIAEAESAVGMFLKTLMAKSLVAMVVSNRQ